MTPPHRATCTYSSPPFAYASAAQKSLCTALLKMPSLARWQSCSTSQDLRAAECVTADMTPLLQMAEARQWIRDHKLKSIGGLWGTGLLGSLAYQWTRPIPTQLKIIHSRVYAQVRPALSPGPLTAVLVHSPKLQTFCHRDNKYGLHCGPQHQIDRLTALVATNPEAPVLLCFFLVQQQRPSMLDLASPAMPAAS